MAFKPKTDENECFCLNLKSSAHPSLGQKTPSLLGRERRGGANWSVGRTLNCTGHDSFLVLLCAVDASFIVIMERWIVADQSPNLALNLRMIKDCLILGNPNSLHRGESGYKLSSRTPHRCCWLDQPKQYLPLSVHRFAIRPSQFGNTVAALFTYWEQRTFRKSRLNWRVLLCVMYTPTPFLSNSI